MGGTGLEPVTPSLSSLLPERLWQQRAAFHVRRGLVARRCPHIHPTTNPTTLGRSSLPTGEARGSSSAVWVAPGLTPTSWRRSTSRRLSACAREAAPLAT
jgi:hypothetical protein